MADEKKPWDRGQYMCPRVGDVFPFEDTTATKVGLYNRTMLVETPVEPHPFRITGEAWAAANLKGLIRRPNR